MSNTIIYHLFGAIGYDCQRFRIEAGSMRFEIKRKSHEIQCPKCRSKEITFKGSVNQLLRAMPVGHHRNVYLDVKIHKIKCKECGSRLQEEVPIIPTAKIHHTKRFESIAWGLLEIATVQAVARHCQMSWGTVKEIDKRRLKRKKPKIRLKDLRYIAIDEIYLGKKKQYKTIVIDLISGRIIYVGAGRGAEALKKFLKKIKRYKDKLQAVAMDMSGAYYSAVTNELKGVDVIFDHFHIVKLMNEKIDKIRREYQNSLNDENKEVIKGKRYLLLKNPDNLDTDQKQQLDELLELNSPLTTAYILKEDLRQLWDCQSFDEGETFLDNWIQKAIASGIKQLKTMANTLTQYKEGVLNYFKHRIQSGALAGKRVSSARLEGINNKIKTMLRACYGLRDDDYLELKLRCL